jgi:hypothetical protein
MFDGIQNSITLISAQTRVGLSLKRGRANPSQLAGMGKFSQQVAKSWFYPFCITPSCLATLDSDLCRFVARMRMAMSMLRATVSFYYEKHGYTMGEPPP